MATRFTSVGSQESKARMAPRNGYLPRLQPLTVTQSAGKCAARMAPRNGYLPRLQPLTVTQSAGKCAAPKGAALASFEDEASAFNSPSFFFSSFG
ncbi:hypothetical protein M513_05050 [Trichuris suis]|uniref:Uncharacterized protein n=1 Tax=Trichuris suis TaxID=68888 RepID=A0A085M9Y5_9BILA|nr:hypothetical protein M513_05050 [Trichuris suis]